MKDDLIKALIKEIDIRQNYLPDRQIETIYLGGGTPSILNEKDLCMVFDKINEHYIYSINAEITLEANPEDITKEKLKAWKGAGINRLSIGIQSFEAEELKFMNRNHNSRQSTKALCLAKESGFDNISADLIFGVPNSTQESWISNLNQMQAFEIPHLSCYALTVEEHTVLHHQIKTGKTKVLSEEKAAEQFIITHEFLAEKGYEHYEISNYALAGNKAIHNTNYWNAKPYLGLGPAAHSFDGSSRQWNVANNKKYINALDNGLSYSQKEILSDDDQFNEFVMTGLRTAKGCDLNKLKTFGTKYQKHFEDKMQKYLMDKSMISDDNHVSLTPNSMLLSDQIIADLFY